MLLAANILAITVGIIDLNQRSRRISERNISQGLCSGHQGAEPRYTAVNHDFHPFFYRIKQLIQPLSLVEFLARP